MLLPAPFCWPRSFLGWAALIGALVGAWIGCFVMELVKNRPVKEALDAAFGAMMGRFLGTVCKIGVGGVMLALTAQRIWPNAPALSPSPPLAPDALDGPAQVVMLFLQGMC